MVGSSEVRTVRRARFATVNGCSAAKRWSGDPEAGSGPFRVKKPSLRLLLPAEGQFPMKAVAETLEVACSHLHDKVRLPPKPRGSYRKACDDTLMMLVPGLANERPTSALAVLPPGEKGTLQSG